MHRTRSGRRLDLIAATQHDKYVRADYERLRSVGIRTAREGVRWHLIEKKPYHYDFSSLQPFLQAAEETGVQVIWDLFHYGWPDDLDIFAPEFINRISSFAGAFTRMIKEESDEIPFICPVNEISFFAWAAGDVGVFYPYGNDRGMELKRQLVRAAIAAIEAIRDAAAESRIIHTEPLINVIAHPDHPQDVEAAEYFRHAQYQALDMLEGRIEPELGGHEKYLDIIGVNYYLHNQWFYPDREMIPFGSPLYRPLRQLLLEVFLRYRRRLFIAETGVEDDDRPNWLRYVADETRAAIFAGVPIEGVCLYPIVNHPGWEDDRHCHNGLWDYADETGYRERYDSLYRELEQQDELFQQITSSGM